VSFLPVPETRSIFLSLASPCPFVPLSRHPNSGQIQSPFFLCKCKGGFSFIAKGDLSSPCSSLRFLTVAGLRGFLFLYRSDPCWHFPSTHRTYGSHPSLCLPSSSFPRRIRVDTARRQAARLYFEDSRLSHDVGLTLIYLSFVFWFVSSGFFPHCLPGVLQLVRGADRLLATRLDGSRLRGLSFSTPERACCDPSMSSALFDGGPICVCFF